MNAARRKEIDGALKMLGELKAAIDGLSLNDKLEEIKGIIDQAKDDEQEYRDNMPESLQQSEKAERADTAVSELESAVSTIDELMSFFDELEGKIEEVEGNCDTAKE